MNEQQKQQMYDEPITLKDLVTVGSDYFRELLRKWWIYLLCAIPIGGYFLYQSFTTPVTYPAKLTFMVNEDEGNTLGGMQAILGQFGFPARRGRYNLDKILELAKSRKIVQRMLFNRVDVDGKKDYLANHLINAYELDKRWEESYPELAGFRFTQDSINGFSRLERSALLRTYGRIVGNADNPGLVTNTFSDQTNILTIRTATINEALSIELVKTLFESLKDYYVEQATERQLHTYNLVKIKADSIAETLAGAEYALARFQQSSRSLFLATDKLEGQRLQREVTKLSLVQPKALENLELADFSLQNATPFVQEIDAPIAPLRPEIPSKPRALLIAAIITFLVATLFIALRKAVRDALA